MHHIGDFLLKHTEKIRQTVANSTSDTRLGKKSKWPVSGVIKAESSGTMKIC